MLLHTQIGEEEKEKEKQACFINFTEEKKFHPPHLLRTRYMLCTLTCNNHTSFLSAHIYHLSPLLVIFHYHDGWTTITCLPTSGTSTWALTTCRGVFHFDSGSCRPSQSLVRIDTCIWGIGQLVSGCELNGCFFIVCCIAIKRYTAPPVKPLWEKPSKAQYKCSLDLICCDRSLPVCHDYWLFAIFPSLFSYGGMTTFWLFETPKTQHYEPKQNEHDQYTFMHFFFCRS